MTRHSRTYDEKWGRTSTVFQQRSGSPNDVLEGPLTDRLLTYVAENGVDLLFVGHQSRTPGRKAVARRLAMKAPCSAWMVPENSPPTIGRMLVPVDFSRASADSVGVATSLAALVGGVECVALHVYFNEAVITYEGYDQVLRGEERQTYERFIQPLNLHGVEVRPVFEESSNAAHAIVRIADRERADLIVMATRGRSASAAILLGSTAEDTIIDTRTPILIVKHFGARMGVLSAILDRDFQRAGGVHTS